MAGTLIRGDSFKDTLTLSEAPAGLDFVRISITQGDYLVGELWYEPDELTDKGEINIEIPPEITAELLANEHLVFSASYKLKDGSVQSSCINTSVLIRSRPNSKPMERPHVKP